MRPEDMRDAVRHDVKGDLDLDRGKPQQLGALLAAQKAIDRAIDYHEKKALSHAEESAKMAERYLDDYREGPFIYGPESGSGAASGEDEHDVRSTLKELNREWQEHIEDENTTGFVGVIFDDPDERSDQGDYN